jgi:hypothetical protein
MISEQLGKSQGRKKRASKLFRAVSPEVKGRINGCILDSDNIIRNKNRFIIIIG